MEMIKYDIEVIGGPAFINGIDDFELIKYISMHFHNREKDLFTIKLREAPGLEGAIFSQYVYTKDPNFASLNITRQN